MNGEPHPPSAHRTAGAATGPAASHHRALDRHLVLTAAVGAAIFAILAVLVDLRWTTLLRMDGAVAGRTHGWAQTHPSLVHAATLVSDVARPETFELVSAATVVGLLLRRCRRTALPLATATLAAIAAGPGFKALVGRPRPALAHPLAHANGWSFPSSHALGVATAMAAYVLVLGRVGVSRSARRILGAAGSVLAVTVAASRVVLGVHYLSDVVAGLVLGVMLACASFVVWRPSSTPAEAGPGRRARAAAAAPSDQSAATGTASAAINGDGAARFHRRRTNSTQAR